MIDTSKVRAHYSPEHLVSRLEAALTEAGLGEGIIPLARLGNVDQFHAMGYSATEELAALCDITPGMKVLDIGSGLGGPSRYLAQTFGGHVSGIDLSPDFVAAAQLLTQRTGLEGKVDYLVADALNLPFEDETFDLAWTQHVAMNIADRPALYHEIARVLKSGARFAIFDIMQGEGGEILYPMPWAKTAETSFLLTMQQMREVLEQSGFSILHWKDTTAEMLASVQSQIPAAPSALSLPALMGPDFKVAGANIGANLKEGRGALLQAVVVKA